MCHVKYIMQYLIYIFITYIIYTLKYSSLGYEAVNGIERGKREAKNKKFLQ